MLFRRRGAYDLIVRQLRDIATMNGGVFPASKRVGPELLEELKSEVIVCAELGKVDADGKTVVLTLGDLRVDVFSDPGCAKVPWPKPEGK